MGIPFYRFEHPSLLKAFQLLNPSVKLPSCFHLSTTFLDVRSLTRMEFELGGAMVAIVTDGRTDINGLAVIYYVAVSGKKTYFLESVYRGCQGHDAAYLVSNLKRVIAKYKL
ncbi:Transposase [Phytophthora megakarya]|uniref:Transposase n=1 Tax=Phytophthora megakarya TaxID=4795 RepID=A0A225WWJ6_9STRA|nr:Transposase [Phytophthora megakarya]